MVKIAVIQTGGKQYVVKEGDVLSVEKISANDRDGEKVTFNTVLLADDGNEATLGTPAIGGAKVSAEIVADGRARKVTVIKYKQKSRYFKKRGHRQPFTKVRISALP